MYRETFSGKLKAMYIIGYDPAATQANIHHVKSAMRKLDLLVVQEIFMTETVKLAHVVLPAGCFFEKDGTFSNTERRVRRLNQAIPLPKGTKHDWEIICLIASAMGYPMHYNHPGEIMREIASLTPEFAGIDYERLEGGRFLCHKNRLQNLGTIFSKICITFFIVSIQGIKPSKKSTLITILFSMQRK